MNPYNKISQLGQGTFGTVHLCEKKHNGAQVVIKEINGTVDSEHVRIARNEVSVLRTLRHPNVVQYYDSYHKDQTFHIVMEYARHGTLHDLISRSRPDQLIERTVVLRLFVQILLGLDYIHARNIVHLDLKCENIFLTGDHGDVVKIGDFGVSTILASKDKTSTFMGTLNYLAPELCSQSTYTAKVDIWSLGCILYEMCALERMFEGPVSHIVLSIKNGFRKLVNIKKYGVAVQKLIETMLEEDQSRRPSTKLLKCCPVIQPILHEITLDQQF